MNPYQPPTSEIQYPTWGRRFRRALQRATAEYRRGLRRDQFTGVQHARSWIALLTLLLVVLFVVIVWSHFLVESIGLIGRQ